MKFLIILFIVTFFCEISSILTATSTTPPLPGTESARKQCPHCACGTPAIPEPFPEFPDSPRIVGGVPVPRFGQPWMVGIKDNNVEHNIFCGGSLINDRYVLTAAHCTQTKGVDYSKVTLELGCYNESDPTEKTLVIRKIGSIIVNEGYAGPLTSYANDIALIKMNMPVIYSKAIRPICLPLLNLTYVAHPGTAVGWGKIIQEPNNILREVRVEVYSQIYCQKKFTAANFPIPDHTVCFGSRKPGKDSCLGDSGGPLLVTNKFKRKEIIGVISTQISTLISPCGNPDYPTITTRVYDFVDWIMKNTQDACHCSVMPPEYDIRQKIS